MSTLDVEVRIRRTKYLFNDGMVSVCRRGNRATAIRGAHMLAVVPSKRVTGYQGKRGRARAEMPNTSVPNTAFKKDEKKRVTAPKTVLPNGETGRRKLGYGVKFNPTLLPKDQGEAEAPNGKILKLVSL